MKRARILLGRRVKVLKSQPDFVDWAAHDAVKKAARELGLAAPLLGWVRPGRTCVTDMADDFLDRWAQAYGPIDGRIEVGAHFGAPLLVLR